MKTVYHGFFVWICLDDFLLTPPPTKQNTPKKDLTFWGWWDSPPKKKHAVRRSNGQLLGVRLATKASFLHRILRSKLETHPPE